VRLFPLRAGPITIRLQELRSSDCATWKFRRRLARAIVIDLAADDEAFWGEHAYGDLLAALRLEKVQSLTFASGRFQYRYKEADPDHDGLMGWIWASREKLVGPELAPCIAKVGLPATLTELVCRDAGIDAVALDLILSSLPPRVETLDLQANDLGDTGLRALGAPGVQRLRELRIGWPAFGDASAATLVDAVEAAGGRSRLGTLARLVLAGGSLSEPTRSRLVDRFGTAVVQLA